MVSRLVHAALLMILAGLMFAAIGDQAAAIAACAIGTAIGITAAWLDPTIRPWN